METTWSFRLCPWPRSGATGRQDVVDEQDSVHAASGGAVGPVDVLAVAQEHAEHEAATAVQGPWCTPGAEVDPNGDLCMSALEVTGQPPRFG